MKQYTTIDKSKWEFAKDEPDKVQYKDGATGLDCLIVRNHGGALCGYVGVSTNHPWHGKDYDQIPSDISVHGGITYADGCQHGDESRAICHIPEPGEPDNLWWFGFDCAHLGDICPAWDRDYYGDTYKDINYVKSEIECLARQLAEAIK